MATSRQQLISRVTKVEQLSAAEVAAWDGICRNDPAFASAFFSRQFAGAVSGTRPDVRVCVLQRDGKAVGFLPFQYSGALSAGLCAAERVGGHLSDYFGLIGENDVRVTPAELLAFAGLSHLSFSHLDETQLAFGLHAKQEGFGVRYDVSQGADAYWAQIKARDRDFHSDMLRKQRRAERDLGPIKLVYDQRDDGDTLQKLIHAKRSQYESNRVNDALAAPWSRDLLLRLSSIREDLCTGLLSVLYAGDTWVSMHFGLRCRHVLHIWFPVYNPQVAAYSPGRLLMKSLIDNAATEGIHVLDDGEATESQQQKRQMGNSRHRYFRGEWSRPGLRGFAARARGSLQWRIEKLARRRS